MLPPQSLLGWKQVEQIPLAIPALVLGQPEAVVKDYFFLQSHLL
jgi:hypothetical protein